MTLRLEGGPAALHGSGIRAGQGLRGRKSLGTVHSVADSGGVQAGEPLKVPE